MTAKRRGVVAYQSTGSAKNKSGTGGKLHLDIRCTGLERVPIHPHEASTLSIVRFASYHQMGASARSRPCRICALETVLDNVLAPSVRSRKVFASFTSQPAFCADATRFHANDVSDSGRARLVRIAERLGLETCYTPVGPAAYGLVPWTGAQILAKNLRTLVRAGTGIPDGFFVSTMWTFLQDSPPELRLIEDGGATIDPWEAATLITQAPPA